MTLIIPVAGTWNWCSDWTTVGATEWWRKGSDFHKYVESMNFQYPDHMFIWSGALNGEVVIERLKPEPHTGYEDHRDWIAGGAALSYFLRQTELVESERNVICHSHGLQVVLYACSIFNVRIDRLISVCSPIRHDMSKYTEMALKNIGVWIQVQQIQEDEWQKRGRFADGAFELNRPKSKADVEINLALIDHSNLLHNVGYFKSWTQILGQAFQMEIARPLNRE